MSVLLISYGLTLTFIFSNFPSFVRYYPSFCKFQIEARAVNANFELVCFTGRLGKYPKSLIVLFACSSSLTKLYKSNICSVRLFHVLATFYEITCYILCNPL